MNREIQFVLYAALLAAAATRPARADFLFNLTLDTAALSGPQIVAFGLTDGDGVADNTVTISNFQFGGGGAIAGTADCTLGGALSGAGCSGDLSGGVTLADLDFQAFFSQQFNPGTTLSFAVDTTNNLAAGASTPDAFAVYLCATDFSACYSDDAATGALALLNLAGSPLTAGSVTLNGASAEGLSAPVVTLGSPAVPEPSGAWLLAGVLVLLAAARGWAKVPGRNG